jgi:hypothetical protein
MIEGSREQVLARMRNARMEKLRAKLQQEGIAVPDRLLPPQAPLLEPPISSPVQYGSKPSELMKSRDKSPSRSPIPTPNSNRSLSGKRKGPQPYLSSNHTAFEEEETRLLRITPTIVCPQVKFYSHAVEGQKKKYLRETLVCAIGLL